jgi:hypothetical protein
MTGKPSQECVCNDPECNGAQHGNLVLECSHCDPSSGYVDTKLRLQECKKIMQKNNAKAEAKFTRGNNGSC